MHAVRSSDHDRVAVFLRSPHDRSECELERCEDEQAGLARLQRERRVEDVGGRQAIMEPAAFLAQLGGDRVYERGDVVLRHLLDLRDALG
jgi:hypothetical protein